jgi:hypothetical protein
VHLTLATNGARIPVEPTTPLPFTPGAVYDLEVTGASSQTEPYVIFVTDP